jgi:hypothetical protein
MIWLMWLNCSGLPDAPTPWAIHGFGDRIGNRGWICKNATPRSGAGSIGSLARSAN